MEKTPREASQDESLQIPDPEGEEFMILEEIDIEETFIDGICGVY